MAFLTQNEADDLLAMKKYCFATQRFNFPGLGGSLRIPLHSQDKREEFSLDTTRAGFRLRKTPFKPEREEPLSWRAWIWADRLIATRMTGKYPARICICTARVMATSGRTLCQVPLLE